jgi:TolB protein
MDADGSNVDSIGLPYSEAPSWSPDGTKIVASSVFGSDPFSRNLFIVDPSGARVPIAETDREEASPAWSPDGLLIAFVVGDQHPASFVIVNADIFVADEHGEERVSLTNTPDNEFGPDWSPDGSRIVFERDRDGDFDFDVYVMNADGSDTRQLTDSPGFDGAAVWSPDGQYIAFSTERDGNYEVYVMDADGQNQQNVTNNSASDHSPSWQPIVTGDANCQGGIDAIDAAIMLQYGAGLIGTLPCEDDADVNGDGDIDSVDAALILQYSAGLLDSLPA